MLFVCLGNSFRSRMAEAFANAYGPDVLEADSAGFVPAGRVSRTAQKLLLEKGLTLRDAPPRAFTPRELEEYDLIVNLCEFGLPKTATRVVKSLLPDPVYLEVDQQRAVCDAIETLVRTLILQLRSAREWGVSITPKAHSQVHTGPAPRTAHIQIRD